MENEVHNPLGDIKRDIEALVGERVRVVTNKGRRQVVERVGTLESVYPSVFVVRMDGQVRQRVSFAYADVLTAAVRVTLCAPGDGPLS